MRPYCPFDGRVLPSADPTTEETTRRAELLWEAITEYEQEMEKAVPEIVQAVADRQALVTEARTRILLPKAGEPK